jgi:hypothetical protein
MSDDGYRRSENYDTFHAARVKRVRIQAVERVDGILSGRDFSAAKWELRFRAYLAPKATGQTFLVNEVLTKLPGKLTDGDTGKAEAAITFAAAAVGPVVCEIVAIDTAVADPATPSGRREYEIDSPWVATVYLSAGAP